MPTTLQRLSLLPGIHPTKAELLIADSPKREDAQVWIRAQFSFGARGDQKHALLALEALDRLQSLIEEAREAATQPPARI